MKNTIKLVIAIIIFLAFVFLHKSVQKNSLDIGLSWTLSAMAPYILQLVSAFLVSFQVSVLLKNKGWLFMRFIFMMVLIAACGIAFWLNPIYEGDFSNNSKIVTVKSSDGDVFQQGLTMVALPGCKFCFGRIPLLNQLKIRNPQLNITVLIVKESPETYDLYSSELVGTINIETSNQGNLIAQITQGRFPAFFYMNSEGQLVFWGEADFGTVALDWVERKN